MNLDDIWLSYSEQMAAVELVQRASRDTASGELQRLQEAKEEMERLAADAPMGGATHTMTFTDAQTGANHFYSHRQLTMDDLLRDTVARKNRQYQWLLVEAYEVFEKFLLRVYAYAAFVNKDAWHLSDYGNVVMSELVSKNFEWYETQAGKKNGAPQIALARLRCFFPMLTEIERNNSLKVDLKFAIFLFAQMRHLIVHNQGQTNDFDCFVHKVAGHAGRLNNNAVAEENRNLVEQFFRREESVFRITLLEAPIQRHLPINLYVCRLGLITNLLMSYAFLLVTLARARLLALPDQNS